jgi:UDP-glucose 4-epimerase
LVASGAEVTSLSRGGVAHLRTAARIVLGDVRDGELIARLVRRNFDHVFHLAAYSGQVPGFTDHELSLTINCLGQLNLLEAIRRDSPGTRICVASSRLVYGRTPHLPVPEDHPREPLSFYGIHKRTAEDYCYYYAQRWGIATVVVRMSNPYGPHAPSRHSKYNVANWMIDRLVAGDEVSIFGDGAQLRDYVHVDDAVDAMLAAASSPAAAGRVYNVGSGAPVPLVEFAGRVQVQAGSGRLRLTPWPPDVLQVETGDFVADISRIRSEVGWTPRVSLDEGIATTVSAARELLSSSVKAAA